MDENVIKWVANALDMVKTITFQAKNWYVLKLYYAVARNDFAGPLPRHYVLATQE